MNTEMAVYRIESLSPYGFWADDWAGDPSDNVFASAAEAWDELPRILASFGDRPADESDEYAPAFTPEYRVVEIV